jgi:hypothetical protein
MVLAAALEGGHRGREEGLEQGADAVGERDLLPGGVLLGAGEDLQGGHGGAIGRQRAVRACVGAQDVGQHHRVEGVGLGW